MTPYMKSFLLVAALMLLMLVMFDKAHAADPVLPAKVPAPVFWVGARMCHEVVIWVTLDDGNVRRADKDHLPSNLKAFFAALKDVPHDVYEFPCPSHSTGPTTSL